MKTARITLIELRVVIAVIAMLAAILLLAPSRARQAEHAFAGGRRSERIGVPGSRGRLPADGEHPRVQVARSRQPVMQSRGRTRRRRGPRSELAITQHPADAAIHEGGALTFRTVTDGGCGALTFQRHWDGTSLAATGASLLRLADITSDDAAEHTRSCLIDGFQ